MDHWVEQFTGWPMTLGLAMKCTVGAGDLLPLGGDHLLDQVTCLLKPWALIASPGQAGFTFTSVSCANKPHKHTATEEGDRRILLMKLGCCSSGAMGPGGEQARGSLLVQPPGPGGCQKLGSLPPDRLWHTLDTEVIKPQTTLGVEKGTQNPFLR